MFLKGKCDDIVKELSKECGWQEELDEMCKKIVVHPPSPKKDVDKLVE